MLLNTLYCAAPATKMQTSGAAEEESLFTEVFTIALCPSLIIIFPRVLYESLSHFYCGLHLTLELVVRVERKARSYFNLCPSI